MATQHSGVLLLGSSPMTTATEFFEKTIKSLPGRLCSVPDGETGDRSNFIAWQHSVLPIETVQPRWGGQPSTASKQKRYSVADIKPTGYDDRAIASYKDFCQLREKGIIPPGVRFQVCLPTPLSVIRGFIETEFCSQLEPLYEKRMLDAVDMLQKDIPASDLTIQFDLPTEIALLESERGRMNDPYFEAYFKPVKEGIMDRILRLVSAVGQDVKIGFHLCYGDMGHVHFVQPVDAQLLVELANDLVKVIGPEHSVEYIHMPVPKDRTDEAYFESLQDLRINGTQLFLGLVHANDEDGTTQRIRLAEQFYRDGFGVATECGLGRSSVADMESALRISSAVTASEA